MPKRAPKYFTSPSTELAILNRPLKLTLIDSSYKVTITAAAATLYIRVVLFFDKVMQIKPLLHLPVFRMAIP